MVVINFAKPSATVEADGRLKLIPTTPSGDMIANGDGVVDAAWVRFFTAAGVWMFDADVSGLGGEGLLKFSNTKLIAGGLAPIATSYLG